MENKISDKEDVISFLQKMDPKQLTRKALNIEAWSFLTIGVIALIFPFAFGIAFEIIFGISVSLGGLFLFTQSLKMRSHTGEWRGIVTGCMLTLMGTLLLSRPYEGLLTMTVLMGIYFAFQGFMKLFLSFSFQIEGRGWMIVSAGLSLFLSYIIIAQLPFSAAWSLGFIVGVDALFFSGALFSLSSALQKKKT